jgi:holliday junction resolvase Hjr
MSRKSKGINAERELIHLFWKNGWAAVRVAGSGSSRYPSADVIASNAVRRIAIESKVTKENSKYFSDDEILGFKDFCSLFGAEPWIGIKFNKNDWYFVSIEDLKRTSSNQLISVEIAKTKGLRFDELLKP